MRPRGTKPLDRQRNRTASFYEAEASVYDQRRWSSEAGRRMDQSQRAIVRDLAGDCRGKRVLEIGPGTGRFSVELAQSGSNLYLTDIAFNMLRVTRQRLEEIGLCEGSYLVQAEIGSLPFPSNSFDLGVAINVFGHLSEPYVAIKELARVLRPRSVLLFNVPNLLSWFGLAALLVNWRRQSLGRPVYSHWYTLAEIKSLLQGAGLTVRSLIGHVHVPTILQRLLVADALSWLDKYSRDWPLNKVAPVLFIKAEKGAQ